MSIPLPARSALAAAVCGLIGAGAAAQSSVTIYGTIDANVQTRNRDAAGGGRQTELATGGLRPSILGFRGSEDLGGGLKAFFNLESHYSSDSGASTSAPGTLQAFRRQSNVGLSGSWGSVTLGRQYAPAIIGTLATEPRLYKEQFSNLYVWAYNQLSAPGNALGAGTNTSNDVGVFVGNAITYSIATGPWYAGLSYSLGEQANDSRKGREISFGASYSGPVTLGLGYQRNDDTLSGVELSRLYSAGVAVPFGAFTGRLHYIDVVNRNPVGGARISKVDGIGVGVDLKWGGANTTTVALYHNRYEGVASQSTTKSLVLSNDYVLSKRTTLYAQLAHVDADAVGAADPLQGLKGSIVVGGTAPGRKTTLLGVGINHTF